MDELEGDIDYDAWADLVGGWGALEAILGDIDEHERKQDEVAEAAERRICSDEDLDAVYLMMEILDLHASEDNWRMNLSVFQYRYRHQPKNQESKGNVADGTRAVANCGPAHTFLKLFFCHTRQNS